MLMAQVHRAVDESKAGVISYADDLMTGVFRGEDVAHVIEKVKAAARSFGEKKSSIHWRSQPICSELPTAEALKFLGVIMDRGVTWTLEMQRRLPETEQRAREVHEAMQRFRTRAGKRLSLRAAICIMEATAGSVLYYAARQLPWTRDQKEVLQAARQRWLR
eukprot:Gregarina_sp_Poly_1__2025@NODE_1530_length_3920_cov_383_726966_g666_i1_p1_GENE_NODE_1530_length_3920_cov_383_726966_g666_i1NODE_1530_length_3920_cov_383_726966_g666_i1_p1_ORF_typecomplete_len162_score12_16TFIIB/PF00382_19/0_00064DMPK_coil/PF08826_10/1_8e04DMPK_coil/PF08826_10/0_19DUF4736/PF15883_5/6_3e03DUF4736/PF15883_5/0_33_NODE_1530_length_3920_cov_383_726966_g666_i121122597